MSEHQAAVGKLEQMVSEQAASLAKSAPRELRLMLGLISELKASGTVPASAQKTMRELFEWQLGVLREGHLKRAEALEQSSRERGATALRSVVAVIDEAKKVVSSLSRSPLALEQLDQASVQARAHLRGLHTFVAGRLTAKA